MFKETEEISVCMDQSMISWNEDEQSSMILLTTLLIGPNPTQKWKTSTGFKKTFIMTNIHAPSIYLEKLATKRYTQIILKNLNQLGEKLHQ